LTFDPLVAGEWMTRVPTLPLVGAPAEAADSQLDKVPPEIVVVSTAALFVVTVPALVSGGENVTDALILHATGNAGDAAPASMVGAVITATLAVGKAMASAPSRTFTLLFMWFPCPRRIESPM
jgi:hypothetical protein